MTIGFRTTSRSLALLLAASLAGSPAIAQTGNAIIPEQDERQTLTDDLIGQPVLARTPETDDHENVGSIDGLLLNENNRLTGAVVSVGGFLGFGAKSIALDWNALEIEQFGETQYVVTIDMSREQLEEAPAFKTLAEKEAERARQQMEQQPPQPAVGGGVPAAHGTGAD